MARIRSRRADGAPGEAPPPQDAAASPSEQPTVVAPAAPDAAAAADALPAGADAAAAADAVPAGADPAAASAPSFRERGRLRRRLRYLRRVRELAFRDLGGLVFDLDRFGRDRPDLVRAKLDALRAIDGELRQLEIALDDARPVEVLEEPGIAACARCGTLHGSEARFCPGCGAAAGAVPEDEPATVSEPAPATGEAPPEEQETSVADSAAPADADRQAPAGADGQAPADAEPVAPSSPRA